MIYLSPAAISRMNAEELAGAKAQLWKRHNEISGEGSTGAQKAEGA